MRFLLDVNAGRAIADLLLELGHDVELVALVDSGMADGEILDWAIREERIIITTDSDFDQMVWLQQRQHFGILRLENLPRAERMLLFQEVLENHLRDLEDGAIVIAKRQRIRVRRQREV